MAEQVIPTPNQETAPPTPEDNSPSLNRFDDDVIKRILSTGENTNGLFTPNAEEVTEENEKLHEETDEKAEVSSIGKPKPTGKYMQQFQKDMLKNPDEYFLDTPKGRMSIKQAVELGFDPATNTFKEPLEEFKKKQMAELSPSDAQAVEQLLDPRNVQLAPADADAKGIPRSSPLVKALPEEAGASPEGMPGAVPPGAMPPGVEQAGLMDQLGGIK